MWSPGRGTPAAAANCTPSRRRTVPGIFRARPGRQTTTPGARPAIRRRPLAASTSRWSPLSLNNRFALRTLISDRCRHCQRSSTPNHSVTNQTPQNYLSSTAVPILRESNSTPKSRITTKRRLLSRGERSIVVSTSHSTSHRCRSSWRSSARRRDATWRTVAKPKASRRQWLSISERRSRYFSLTFVYK